MEDGALCFRSLLGDCSTLEVELWGVYIGLGCAWARGLRRVLVETDCMEACRLLQGGLHASDISNLTKHIHEICKRGWMISFHHVSHSENKVADFLVKQVNGVDFDIYLFDNPLTYVVHCLQDDEG
ncbi:hypothetical protein V6N11_019188 [Hibiscus sabdariffa]|uniref:RNase H type-1 domain-containing protein n=1 Tax=Hibiscus sabdariffa TaxID=183260 RepID=A0ABR2R1L5_9ROSI